MKSLYLCLGFITLISISSCKKDGPDVCMGISGQRWTQEPIFTTNCTDNATSYLWDFGDGTTSTQEEPEHTYSAAGTYTVTLTATNSNGSTTKSETVTIIEHPLQRFVGTYQGTSSSCTGGSTKTVHYEVSIAPQTIPNYTDYGYHLYFRDVNYNAGSFYVRFFEDQLDNETVPFFQIFYSGENTNTTFNGSFNGNSMNWEYDYWTDDGDPFTPESSGECTGVAQRL